MANNIITDISVTYNVALVTVDNLPKDVTLISDVFNSIAKENINIDMISQTPPYRDRINLSFSINSEDMVKAIGALNQYKADIPDLHIEVDADNTKISVFGEEMKNFAGVAARMFKALSDNGIYVKLVTTSEVDISCLIYEKDVDRARDAIKTEFGLK